MFNLRETQFEKHCPGVKRPGRGVDHPAASKDEVEERIELKLSIPLCAFMALYKVNFTFFFFFTVTFRASSVTLAVVLISYGEFLGDKSTMYIVLLMWLYNSLCRVLAFSTNSFQFLISRARVFQFGTFNFCISFLTSSTQLVLSVFLKCVSSSILPLPFSYLASFRCDRSSSDHLH
jgi:hypothetical protein